MCNALKESGQYPELRSLLCIGGINMAEQADVLNKGVHIAVATPGRLMDMLDKGRLNANNCKCVWTSGFKKVTLTTGICAWMKRTG